MRVKRKLLTRVPRYNHDGIEPPTSRRRNKWPSMANTTKGKAKHHFCRLVYALQWDYLNQSWISFLHHLRTRKYVAKLNISPWKLHQMKIRVATRVHGWHYRPYRCEDAPNQSLYQWKTLINIYLLGISDVHFYEAYKNRTDTFCLLSTEHNGNRGFEYLSNQEIPARICIRFDCIRQAWTYFINPDFDMFSICGDLFDIDLKVIINRLGVPPFVLSV
jgi:hypothetical protein